MKYSKLCRVVIWFLLLTITVGCSDKKEESVTQPVEEKQEKVVTEEVKEEVEEIIVEEVKEVVPTFGGTLKIASKAPSILDPLTNDRQSVHQVLGLVYESLFELDEQLMPTPMLAESYSFDNDGKVLNIKLKEGILFHDESPLTAADIKYTIETIQKSDYSMFKEKVFPIQRVTVVDDYNFIIYYNTSYAYALNDLIFPIVSKTYSTGENYDPLKPVGTGPYVYVDYQMMQHLDLTANMDWHQGDLYVENIHCIMIKDDQTYETLFDQHLIDVMNPRKFNWLKYSENDQHKIDGYISSYYDFIGFNMSNPVLADVNLRKAVAYGVNREFILYDRFVNHGVLAESPVLPNSWFKTDGASTYMYDVVKATELLKEIQGDNDTIELSLMINESNPLKVNMSEYIKNDLDKAGLSINIEVVEKDVYFDRLANKDYDMVYGGWKLSGRPDYYELFASDGSQNFVGYSNEEMDAILNEMFSAYNEDTIYAQVSKFEEVFTEDLPYVSLYFLEGAVMKHKKVYGEFTPNTESMFNGIENIYLDLTE